MSLTQKEMADLAECSRPTIQAIELGKLKMSFDLGNRIVFKTGINPDWLLANDVNQPPTTTDGKPYTREHYEATQALLFAPRRTEDQAADEILDVWHLFGEQVQMLASLFAHAYRNGKFTVAAYKHGIALARLIREQVKPEDEAERMVKQAFEAERGPDRFHEVVETVRLYFEDTQAELLRRMKAMKKPVPKELARRPTLPPNKKAAPRSA